MEVGSMEGMRMQGMRPQGGRRPEGDPAEHAEKLSNRIMEEQDTDGDGLLGAGEFDSDLLAALDEDGDGVLSQEELQSGIQSRMEEGKAAFESGEMPSAENREFMQTMHSLAGDEPRGSRAMASRAYGMMQESMVGNGQAASYNTDQMLLDSLDLAV